MRKLFNRRWISFILVLLFLAATAFVAHWAGRALKLRSVLAASRSPYTITFREAGYTTNPDGTPGSPIPTFSKQLIKARKTDGSSSVTFFDPDELETGTAGQMTARRILSVADRQDVNLFLRSGTKSSLLLRPEEIAAAKAPPKDPTCLTHPERVVQWQVLGRGSYLGVDVVKLLYAPTNGTTVIEAWEAPQLDCEAVYSKVLFKGGSQGEFKGETIRSATNIKLVEPDESLFAISGAEMPPSAAYKSEVRAIGQDPDRNVKPALSQKFQRKDAAYAAQWANATPSGGSAARP